MKKNVVYSLADAETNDLFQEVLNVEEFSHFKIYGIRCALITISTVTEDGEVLPSFPCLPYRVKLISLKDQILKNVDVEIHIDEKYWSSANEKKKFALLSAALSQIFVVLNRDGMPVELENGSNKLKLIKPDINYFGFSNIIEQFGDDSPDIAAWNEVKVEFADLLN